jgi:ATP-dependent Lon protease
MDSNRFNKEMMVMPITQTVLFPESNARIRVSPDLARQLKYRIEKGDDLAVALSAKKGFDANHVDTDNLFSTGTLIFLDSITSKRGHDIAYVKVHSRVAIESIRTTEDAILARVVPAKDHMDMDSRDQDRMLAYIKEITSEISTHFKGSEHYVKEIEKVDSIPGILGYLMPFIPVSVEEKQQLLEMDSVKQRGIAFMDILLQHKESITLQMEMAQKFSDQANQNYRKSVSERTA